LPGSAQIMSLNFQMGLAVFVSHVKLSVQYFVFSIEVEDDFFFFCGMAAKHTQMCVQKNP